MNQIKQHTQKWMSIKRFNFGANDIASLLSVGFSDTSKIIADKIEGRIDDHDPVTQKLLDRGNRYEPIVRNLFKQRHRVRVIETGLKHHAAPYTYITASPDGYCRCATESPNSKLNQIGDFLVEFKVRTELSTKIPLKYWVQMQVQMAVWDIDHCMYCENLITESDTPTEQTQTINWEGQDYYWRLVEYREHIVSRDREWWSSVLPKIAGYWSLVETGRNSKTRAARKRKAITSESDGEHELKCRREFSDRLEQTIQPYMLGNYFRNDPLLDWLNLYGPPEKRDTEVNFFLSMIRNKNRTFNALVSEYIKKRFPESFYDACPEPFQVQDDVELHKLGYTFETIERTTAAMERKVPIIFNACFNSQLPSYPYPFGGRADMIVQNQYIGDLLDLTVVPDGPEDAYTIVNFKYATINLRADKVHLLNNPKQKVYKAHLWLLNSALAVKQGYTPTTAYLIGRKYDFKKCGITYRINNAFKGIGEVDFTDDDNDYEDSCRQALEWLRIVRTTEAQSWDPFHPETSAETEAAPYMYPNMKNAMDYPWSAYKREIAHAIKDITLMYHCGPKVRDYAHSCGVTEWQELTSESIIYHSGKLLDQIMEFVDINAGDGAGDGAGTATDTAINKISRKGYINGRPGVEFYLDFEAIGNMYDDFSKFPEASSQAMIFLVGLITVDNVTGQRNYVSYLIDQLDHHSERQMIAKMLTDMHQATAKYDQDFTPVYFWSNAENYMLKRAMGPDIVKENRLVMVDLCKAFRDAKVILPGQMGYGLKDVAKTMHRHGMIKTIWDESAEVASGLNATIEAMKTYNRDPETRRLHFRNLIDYNYVDCKVMEEILEYLRSVSVRGTPYPVVCGRTA